MEIDGLLKMTQSLEHDGIDETGVSVDVYKSLTGAIEEFQVRAEKLSKAYWAMRNDFKNVNIELEKKNEELARSLSQQEDMQIYLNSILESMDNGVIGVDRNGRITQFNRAASEISGYNVEKVMGELYVEVFQASEEEPALLHILRTAKKRVRSEKVIWHADGHPVPVSFQTYLLNDHHGRFLGAVEIFSDNSRIKALEEEMHQTKTMAALGEMSATVAHEIRNPLGAMGMWAGLLERDLEPDDSRRKTLGKITEGLSRLNKIVSNLLVYTRPLRPEFKNVQIRELLEEVVDFVQIEIERLGRSITIEKRLTESQNCQVSVDPEKMSQVIMNLCLNAVQAMPDGGSLTVSIENGTGKNGQFANFSIKDTGIGINREKVAKIFDPFFTTKENGTGLGLAIVKKIVELHSGYINVKSIPNKGTTFRVFLPCRMV